MEMSEQDAFKLGFLARCAEEKLTGAALDARLEKVAEFNKTSNFFGIPGTQVAAKGMSDTLGGWLTLLSLPFGASILGGSALGYGAGNLAEPRVNEDEIKANELATTYKLYADKARARRKAVKYRARAENNHDQNDVMSRI